MYKDIDIDEKEVINDYISVLLFDKHYQKKVRKKNLNKALEKYFKANFDYIYNLKSNNEIKKIFETVSKDEIYQNLKLDLQRKIIICFLKIYMSFILSIFNFLTNLKIRK